MCPPYSVDQRFRVLTFRRRLPQVLRFSFNAPGPGAYAVKTMMALLHRLDEQQTLKDVTNIASWILVNSSYLF